MTTCVLPDSSSSIRSASVAEAGLPKISPCRTTSVSTPSTGRSSTRSATLRALPCACSRTTSTASARSGGIVSSYSGSTTSKGMPSCSRIARRCRERDASSSGDVSATCAGYPELFVRPLLRPFRRNVVVVRVRLGVVGCIELDQALELEAVRVQQVEQLAVRKMELDLASVRPLEAVQAALRAHELLADPFQC